MSNRLSMAKINSIETLHASGHSNREIARLLGINRKTVNRYVLRLKQVAGQKGPNPQTDSGGASVEKGRGLQPEMGQLVAGLSDQPQPKSGPTPLRRKAMQEGSY